MNYLPHHRDNDYKTIEECDTFYKSALSLVILIGTIGLMCWSCVDGMVKQAELDEQAAKKRTWTVEQSYSRPAAYHLASPTEDQMDQLHAIMTIQEVRR